MLVSFANIFVVHERIHSLFILLNLLLPRILVALDVVTDLLVCYALLSFNNKSVSYIFGNDGGGNRLTGTFIVNRSYYVLFLLSCMFILTLIILVLQKWIENDYINEYGNRTHIYAKCHKTVQ